MSVCVVEPSGNLGPIANLHFRSVTSALQWHPWPLVGFRGMTQTSDRLSGVAAYSDGLRFLELGPANVF